MTDHTKKGKNHETSGRPTLAALAVQVARLAETVKEAYQSEMSTKNALIGCENDYKASRECYEEARKNLTEHPDMTT